MNWIFVPGCSRLFADREVENGGVGGRWPASTPMISSYMIELHQLHLEITIMTDLLDFELHPEVRLCLQSQTLSLQA